MLCKKLNKLIWINIKEYINKTSKEKPRDNKIKRFNYKDYKKWMNKTKKRGKIF